MTMIRLILLLALCLPIAAQAALRPGTGPTMPVPTPDVPVTSWQPPFSVLR